MATQVPENFVLGQIHHSMSFQLVVVPGHTKQTLLQQCLVSHTSLIIFKLRVPVATHSYPPPALSSAHYTNVLHHPGSSDVGQRNHQGQLLRRNIQQPLALHSLTLRPDGVSSKKIQAINFGLCGTLQGSF